MAMLAMKMIEKALVTNPLVLSQASCSVDLALGRR